MANPIAQAEIRRRAQDAKEYLIAQIVQEAQLENVPFSEIERKMLYFTESVETSPDIYEVNAQFEQEYDDADYEGKIAELLRNAWKRVQQGSSDGAQRWKTAETNLRNEDHYLGVMVRQSREAPGNFWPVMKWAGVTVVVFFVGLYLDTEGLIPNWVKNLPPRAWYFAFLAFILIVVLVETMTLGELKQIFRKRRRD